MGISRFRISLLLIFCLISFISCQNNKMEEKFEWSATLSAPEEYPVQVYEGNITSEDYVQSLEGFGVIEFGWGKEGGMVVAGPDFKGLPDTLQIAWHSFVNKKNFKGKWPLPKEKIRKLFTDGFTEVPSGQKSTYNTVVIGLAPNGLVVVWLSGAGNQSEVANFMAQETEVSLDKMDDDTKPIFSDNYRNIVLNELDQKRQTIKRIEENEYPPTDVYSRYRIKFNWKPSFVISANDQVTDYSMQFYNGESEVRSLGSTGYAGMHVQERSIPEHITFGWENNQTGKKQRCWLENFDRDEMFAVFKKFQPSEEVEMIIEEHSSDNVSVKLKGKSQEVKIEKFDFTIE